MKKIILFLALSLSLTSFAQNEIRVGGADAIEPTTGLPMYRDHTTFEANYKARYIKVWYNQWLVSNGVKVQEKSGRHYLVIDIPQLTHVIPGDPNADPPTEDSIIVDSPAYPMFTGWQNKLIIQGWVGARLGEDIIIGAIKTTLINLPFDVEDGYKVKP